MNRCNRCDWRGEDDEAAVEHAVESKARRWRVSFAWYDLWVGAFYDQRKRVLYVCPLPCVLLEWHR